MHSQGKHTPIVRKFSGHTLMIWAAASIFFYDSVYSCRAEQVITKTVVNLDVHAQVICI